MESIHMFEEEISSLSLLLIGQREAMALSDGRR